MPWSMIETTCGDRHICQRPPAPRARSGRRRRACRAGRSSSRSSMNLSARGMSSCTCRAAQHRPHPPPRPMRRSSRNLPAIIAPVRGPSWRWIACSMESMRAGRAESRSASSYHEPPRGSPLRDFQGTGGNGSGRDGGGGGEGRPAPGGLRAPRGRRRIGLRCAPRAPPVLARRDALPHLGRHRPLLYEVAFSKLLGYVFGATACTVSAVLSAFMAGLALGAHFGGRHAGRVRRPLMAYGALEMVVGAVCFTSPQALALLRTSSTSRSPARRPDRSRRSPSRGRGSRRSS